MKLIFSNKAKKDFSKLDEIVKNRIIEKLSFLKDCKDDSIFLKQLVNMNPATHRLRVGDYRLILEKSGNDYLVLKIGTRGNIYK